MATSKYSRTQLLDNMYTNSRPFGPASLDEIRTREEAGVLFDMGNELHHAISHSLPTFIVGRRGAGKTAFLKSSSGDDTVTVDLSTPELISQVARTITDLGFRRYGEFTERVVPLWDACFTAAICSRLWSSSSPLNYSDCPPAFDFGKTTRASQEGRPTDAAAQILLATRRRLRANNDFASVRSLLDEIELNGVQLWLARQTLEQAQRSASLEIVVSLDSLDQYKDIFTDFGMLDTPSALALQGLFRAASRMGRAPFPPYRVLITFPAELWHYYSDFSANPLKDFDNCVVLHWDNKELLHICATRLARHLEASNPSEYRKLPAFMSSEVIERYLPSTVTNAMGIEEPTISYILRHTQLLPRHLIQIMNTIFRDYDFSLGRIEPSAVVEGIATAEVTIVDTVIDSFEIIYPYLKEICTALIPNLPFQFTPSQLHSIWNRIPHDLSFHEAQQMLIEVGALGLVVDNTGIYTRADFEYLHQNRLIVGYEDTLCLHPLFAKGFGPRQYVGISPERSREKAYAPVLPMGSDPKSSYEYSRFIWMNRSK